MEFLFKTSAIVIFGVFITLAYIVILILKKRTSEIDLLQLGSVFFSSSSIVGGFKLIYTTFNLLNNTIESDKMYTIYGGFCVIYISVNSLYKKVK